jgi:hypothetical protein
MLCSFLGTGHTVEFLPDLIWCVFVSSCVCVFAFSDVHVFMCSCVSAYFFMCVEEQLRDELAARGAALEGTRQDLLSRLRLLCRSDRLCCVAEGNSVMFNDVATPSPASLACPCFADGVPCHPQVR